MVHGILAARLDAVPEAIECADGPPPLLAAFSSPPGTMNRGGMQANDAEALHRKATVRANQERHGGLANVIVGFGCLHSSRRSLQRIVSARHLILEG